MKKQVTLIFVGIGCALLTLVFFLPTLLSSERVLPKILERIRVPSGAHLKISRCRIGWQQGLVCSNVAYSDPGRGLDFTVDQVNWSQGLLALLAAPKNIGKLQLRHPVVSLAGQLPLHNFFSSLLEPSAQSLSSRSPSPVPDILADKIPFWDILTGTVVIEDGRIEMKQGQGGNGNLSGIISGSFSLADGTIEYAFQWLAGTGKVAGKGLVNMPARWQNVLNALVVRLHVQFSEFQVESLLSLVAQYSDIPTGRGILNGELNVITSGRQSIDLTGMVDARAIELQVGEHRANRLQMERLSLSVDGSKKSRDSWRITRFDLDGDLGELTVRGNHEKHTYSIRGTGTLQVPVLLANFSNVLPVRQEVTVDQGTINFFGEIVEDGSGQTVATDVVLDSLQGRADSGPFSWQQPVTLSLSGERQDTVFFLKYLNLSSSFLQVNGSGQPDDFSLRLAADLDKATLELSTIFSLPWQMGGVVSLLAENGGREGQSSGVDVQIKSQKFSLSREGRVIFPEYPLSIVGEMVLPKTGLETQGITLEANGYLWPGSFSLALNKLKWSSTGFSGAYQVSSTIELGSFAPLLPVNPEAPTQTQLAGELNLDAAGFFTGGQLIVREFDAQVADFISNWGKESGCRENIVLQTRRLVKGDGLPIAISALQVVPNKESWQKKGYGLSGFDTKTRHLFVRDMGLYGTSVHMDIKQLRIEDVELIHSPWVAQLKGSEVAPLAAGKMIKDEVQKLIPGIVAGKKL